MFSLLFNILAWTVLSASSPAASADPVTALAFSPDGAALVSNGPRCIEIRSSTDAHLSGQLPCDLPKVNSLVFSPDGQWLAAAGGTPASMGETLIFHWKTRALRHRLATQGDMATSAAFSPDGRRLGVASANHECVIWRMGEDRGAPEKLFALTGHSGPVLAIAFGPADGSIVTAGADRAVKVWSAEDGRLIRGFSHHTESVHAVVFRPGLDSGAQPACATASSDRTVRVWQPEIGRMVRIVRGHGGPVFATAYSPNGTRIFSAGAEGIVRMIDADSDEILHTWPPVGDWIYSLAVRPDGAAIAAGDWSGSVHLLTLPSSRNPN